MDRTSKATLRRNGLAKRIAGATFGAALLAALGVGVQRCSVYDDSLLAGALVAEAGADAGADADVPDGACVSATWPARVADAGDAGFSATIVDALTSIDLGARLDGGTGDAGPVYFGYDLDGVCTCHGGPPTCVPNGGAKVVCDDEQGRDSASALLFQYLGPFTVVGTDQVNASFLSGENNLLIAIHGYNNTPNQDRVKVEFYQSAGMPAGADGGPIAPVHDGNDNWTILPTSFQGPAIEGSNCEGCQPRYTAQDAYVADGTLVAHFDPLPISFGTSSFFGGASIVLRSAVIVGKLVPMNVGSDGISYSLQSGVIAGRWPLDQLFQSLAFVPDGLNPGRYLCGDDPVYQAMKQVACAQADISQYDNTTRNDPNAPCDAISVGFQFTAQPAHLGVVKSGRKPTAGCVSETGSNWSDCCSCDAGVSAH